MAHNYLSTQFPGGLTIDTNNTLVTFYLIETEKELGIFKDIVEQEYAYRNTSLPFIALIEKKTRTILAIIKN